MTTHQTIESLLASGEQFLKNLIIELNHLKLNTSQMIIDHLCFRVETLEQYHSYKKLFLLQSTLLTETVFNGRLISTFKLNKGLKVGDKVIDCVELPAPKSGVHYSLGFEHAEFIIKETFETFIKRYPNFNFNISGNLMTNPELTFKAKAGQAKFHYTTLERVIEIEQSKISDIIFDFDGTLLQSRETITKINSLVFSDLLQRPVSLEEANQKYFANFSKLLNAYEVTCAHQQKLALSNWSKTSNSFSYEFFAEAKELLHNLSKLNIKIHLWTARDEASTLKILKAHDLEFIFDTLSFSNNLNSKPNPQNLLFEWTLATTNSVLYIGDSLIDMMAAKNIRAISAAAFWDESVNKAELIASGAELFFESISDFSTWLKNKS
ncbi:MAG: VOC family protein [Pseudobdellovibrio sp.]